MSDTLFIFLTIIGTTAVFSLFDIIPNLPNWKLYRRTWSAIAYGEVIIDRGFTTTNIAYFAPGGNWASLATYTIGACKVTRYDKAVAGHCNYVIYYPKYKQILLIGGGQHYLTDVTFMDPWSVFWHRRISRLIERIIAGEDRVQITRDQKISSILQ
jgi:hypothetical protein